MAAKKPPRATLPTAGKVAGHVSELRKRLEADRLQREAAGNGPRSVILDPRDVRGGYDTNRALRTTLGGADRALTADDLATFRRNMRALQSRITSAGLTARQVIDLSESRGLGHVTAPDGDLARARAQITSALVLSSLPAPDKSALDLRFRTSTRGGSSHYCLIRLLGYGEQVRRLAAVPLDPKRAAAEKAPTVKDSVKSMRAGYLKLECDCGRWRYWFRYIATVGGFNAGRDESGFPKVKNPDLKGVACKHLLACVREVESSNAVGRFLEAALVKAGRHTIKQRELDKAVKARPGAIQTTADRKAQREKRSLAEAMKSAPPRAKPLVLSKARQRHLAQLAEALGLAPAEALRRLTQ